MSHKLLSGRNDPGAESTSSSEEESILEVVMDLEPCEPQVWAPLYERQRNALPCLNTVFRQFEPGHKCGKLLTLSSSHCVAPGGKGSYQRLSEELGHTW